MRGVVYARMMEDAKTLPGGVSRLLDELVDPRVRDFLGQKFHFMEWYDAFPLLPSAVAFSRIRQRPLGVHMREVGRESMLKLIPSMFRILSRIGGPRLAGAHAPRLFKTYFDFVELKLARVDDHGGTGTISGVPLYLAPALLDQILGIIAGALESLGAKQIEAGYRDLTVNGSSGGFDLVSCQGDFIWQLEHAAPRPRI